MSPVDGVKAGKADTKWEGKEGHSAQEYMTAAHSGAFIEIAVLHVFAFAITQKQKPSSFSQIFFCLGGFLAVCLGYILKHIYN